MTKSRRERLRDQTFNEIKQTARNQMRELGAAQISLRAIAREMGMSAPAIYRYFANYNELITSLIVDAFNSLADAIEKADQEIMMVAADSSSAETHHNRLKTLCLTYRDWAKKWPQDHLLIFGTPIPNYVAPEAITGPSAQRAMQVLLTILLSAHAHDHLKLPDLKEHDIPATIALQKKWRINRDIVVPAGVMHAGIMLLSALEGLISMELSNRFEGASAEIFPHMLNQQIANLGL